MRGSAAACLLVLLCAAVETQAKPINEAAEAADLEGVKKALANMKNKKTEINARSSDGSGRTAIMAATLKGSVEIVRLLLDEGANLTPVTKPNEWNVLQLAAFEGHDEILQMLIDAGAELDEQVEDGRTAVMMTAQMGRCPSTLKILMDAGADLHVKTEAGRDAALWAAMSGERSADCLTMLTEAGANPGEWLPRESPEEHAKRLAEKRKKEGKDPDTGMPLDDDADGGEKDEDAEAARLAANKRMARNAELSKMKVSALKKEARTAGVDQGELDDADDSDDIKASVIALILAKEGQKDEL